jgi:peptidoglycan biosynthesis protein MviN/MurJ (putative lipid II flippase)
MDDSKTPTIVSIVIILFELSLTYGLVNLFSHFDQSLSVNPLTIFNNLDYYFTRGDSVSAIGGIALASSIAIFFNVSILIYFLNKKGVNFFFESKHIFKKLISAVIMFVVGLVSFKFFDAFFDTNRVFGVFFFTINMTVIMFGTFVLSEKILGDEDISILDDPIKRFRKSTSRFLQILKTDEVTTGVS